MSWDPLTLPVDPFLHSTSLMFGEERTTLLLTKRLCGPHFSGGRGGEGVDGLNRTSFPIQ